MRQLFQDLIRPPRRACSSHAFLLPPERRLRWPPACTWGTVCHPSCLPLTELSSSLLRRRWALWNCLGDRGRSGRQAVLLRRERKEKKREKYRTLQRDGSLGLRAWAEEERGSRWVQSYFLLTSLRATPGHLLEERRQGSRWPRFPTHMKRACQPCSMAEHGEAP